MRWRVFLSGVLVSVVVGAILGAYFASVFPGFTFGMVFGPIFAIGLALSLITALNVWGRAVKAVKTVGPSLCLVASIIWVRHLLGSLIDAPLFVTATDYSVTPPQIGYYLVYFVEAGYQWERAILLDLALVLALIVSLSGIMVGAKWRNKVIVWTGVLNLVLTVLWLAFPTYWDQAAAMVGQPQTQAGRATKQAFEQAFTQRLAAKEAALQALLDRGKPAAPGSPAPTLGASHWEKVAALKKEMETMREDHLKEGKRIFPDLYSGAAASGNGKRWKMCFDSGCFAARGSVTPGEDAHVSITTGGFVQTFAFDKATGKGSWRHDKTTAIGELRLAWHGNVLKGKAQDLANKSKWVNLSIQEDR